MIRFHLSLHRSSCALSSLLRRFRIASHRMLPLAIAIAYASLILGVVTFKLVAPLNNFLKYGKCYDTKLVAADNRFLQPLLSLTVPKSYFQHFYVVFALLMLLVVLFPNQEPHGHLERSNQPLITYILFAQALRRWYECTYIMQPNAKSRMNLAHYILGILFYVITALNCYLGLSASQELHLGPTSIVLTACYVLAAYDQFKNHSHLALLKKYSIPSRGMFRLVACPHYLDEIVIYVSVALLAATSQHTCIALNFSLAALFVAINLSISSRESHAYYMRFGPEYQVKWSIVPGFV